MATLSQSRPTAGHRAQQLQQQTSRPRALQQYQSVLLLLRHGLDHEVPLAFIAWRRVPSTANAGTITKSQLVHFDGGTRPPTNSTKISAGRAPVGRRWCWCRLTGPGQLSSGLPTPRGGARHRTGASGASLKGSWGPGGAWAAGAQLGQLGRLSLTLNCGRGYYASKFGFEAPLAALSCASAAPRHWAGPEGRIGSLTGGLGCLGPIIMPSSHRALPALHPDSSAPSGFQRSIRTAVVPSCRRSRED